MISKELKSEWIDALKFGKYKQCRNSLFNWKKLKKDRAYCCLGVLCVLAKLDVDNAPYPQILNLVPDWKKLADLNDKEKRDFVYIANYIEKNVPAE